MDEPSKSSLHLIFLPGFADFILHHHLHDFTRYLLEYSREENIPLLKYFDGYSNDQLIELSKTSNRELLIHLSENRLGEYIDKSVSEWVANKLLTIDRDVIVTEDITLVSLVRRKVFRLLLAEYTTDVPLFRNIMEEVDRFIARSESASFNAYIRIHQEKIRGVNEELENQRQELLEAQKMAQMGSFLWDMKEGKSSFTPGVMEIFDMTETSDLQSFLGDVHPDDREKLKAAIDRAVNNDGIYECEYRYQRKNFKRIWSRGIVSFEDGKPVSMKGSVMDVTYTSELLDRLQESEELYKQAQALTHIGNWSWNVDTGKLVWSDEMFRVFGLKPQSEKMDLERFISLVHPDYREKRRVEFSETIDGGQTRTYIMKILNPDGREKVIEGIDEVILDPNGKVKKLNGTCQDITHEYQLDLELREKEAHYHQLINNAPDAIIVINDKSIITLWNPRTEAIFGWKAEEVIGKELADTIIPPVYREAHKKGMERFLSTGEARILNQTLELTALDNRNRELHVSLTISQTTQKGEHAFIAFLRDITGEKETGRELSKKSALLEQKNNELLRSNKELESFNYAASHDLQEPLRKIQVFADRISEDEDKLPKHVAGYFNKIISSASRMQSLINDLLAFSQSTVTEEIAEPVDLNGMIEDVKNSLALRIEESGTVIEKTALPVIHVVRFQFMQVFINLLGNAMKYQRPQVAPRIMISSSIVDSMEIKRDMDPGKFLEIRISDNGIGFDPGYAEKIFELFTRLHNKDSYSGTGIGLAICKKIIQNHNGTIMAESREGIGSVFYIYLPVERVINPQV